MSSSLAGLRSAAPNLPAACSAQLEAAAALLSRAQGPVLSLSGAGLSTASGLPDYRSPGRHASPAAAAAAERARMTAATFASSERPRTRYWARSFAGWPRVASARPNLAHLALTELHAGSDAAVVSITQNVDGLGQAAGLTAILELHGTLRFVRCMSCGAREPRAEFQARLAAANPEARPVEAGSAGARPDGDAVLDAEDGFTVPACVTCGADNARVAPDLVFHGGVVPKQVSARARGAVDSCGALVVVGSSVTTYSAYSLVLRAKEAGKAVVVLNHGPGRGDAIVDLLVDGELTTVLPALLDIMGKGAWVR